jgi:hypothetical protein
MTYRRGRDPYGLSQLLRRQKGILFISSGDNDHQIFIRGLPDPGISKRSVLLRLASRIQKDSVDQLNARGP